MRRVFVSAGLGSAVLAVSLAAIAPPFGPAGAQVVSDEKVSYCHATADVTNPYILHTTAVASIIQQGHHLHLGPVFPDGGRRRVGRHHPAVRLFRRVLPRAELSSWPGRAHRRLQGQHHAGTAGDHHHHGGDRRPRRRRPRRRRPRPRPRRPRRSRRQRPRNRRQRRRNRRHRRPGRRHRSRPPRRSVKARTSRRRPWLPARRLSRSRRRPPRPRPPARRRRRPLRPRSGPPHQRCHPEAGNCPRCKRSS